MDQPEFRNAVVALDVPAGPDPATGASALLVALKGLERAFGRQDRERWGPREVDLDLLVFGRHRVDVERPPAGRSEDPAKAPLPLVVPHVEARHRLFVLAPLADLAPGLVPPGWGETVAIGRGPAAAHSRAATPPARSRPGRAGIGCASPRRRSRGSNRRSPSGADPANCAGPAGLQPDGWWPLAVEHVDRVHEADLLGLVGHHQRVGPRAAAEEPDALEQLSVRDAGRREHQVLAARQVLGAEDLRLVGVAQHPASPARAPRRCGTGSGPGSRRPGSAARPR